MYRNKSRWPLLALGMTFLLYSHMLTTLLIALFMLVTFLITLLAIDDKKERIIDVCKAAAVSFVLSAFYLVPFIEQTLGNHLRASWTGFNFVQQPMDVIQLSINNTPVQVVGFTLILVILFGFLYLKQSKAVEKYAYFSGLVLVVLTTKLFPWGAFLHTPLANLQFPYRLDGIATAMLAIYLSFIIEHWIKQLKGHYKVPKILSVAVLAVVMVGLTVNGEHQIIKERSQAILLNKRPTLSNYYIAKNEGNYNLTKQNWHNMFYYYGHNGSFDYFPVTVKGDIQNEVVTHQAIVGNSKRSFNNRRQSKANELDYDLDGIKAGAKVKLPILYYKNDLIKVGNERYKNPSITNVNTIQVRVPKGNKQVSVKYHNSLLDNSSLWLSIIGWIVTIALYLMVIVKRKGKNERVHQIN